MMEGWGFGSVAELLGEVEWDLFSPTSGRLSFEVEDGGSRVSRKEKTLYDRTFQNAECHLYDSILYVCQCVTYIYLIYIYLLCRQLKVSAGADFGTFNVAC